MHIEHTPPYIESRILSHIRNIDGSRLVAWWKNETAVINQCSIAFFSENSLGVPNWCYTYFSWENQTFFFLFYLLY